MGKLKKRDDAGGGAAPAAMRGVVASAARGRPVHGAAGTSVAASARQALCDLLGLRDPSDEQLFRDAGRKIGELMTGPTAPQSG